jgi:hypothetical protein
MPLKKVQYTAKAHTPGAFGLLSRFLVVLFAATVSLASTVNVLAQQPAQMGALAQGATRERAVFPDEIYRAPETWARRAYPNLIYFHEVEKGGHFAAWEQPQLFTEEMRAAFRSLRWLLPAERVMPRFTCPYSLVHI